ncbi:Nitric oxide synthase-interacting protein [Orchesella cincta]|uniref:Nitric oxide synthase-interacting protein homolog n=1 Tax=Orchesella cincta TaxID=48709 RepID=A0A1D2MUG2_ORCCI|nr:Nitric oxide synthase-interacting protein [Orchesella cincta]
MTRHARNCTAGAVYTYHERKKDSQASGYGSQAQRLGKDSVRNFDCCCLTLQPCPNPVITLDGYLYDKEAILEYVIAKKNEYSRALKEYEKQKKREERELEELAALEQANKVDKFVKAESNITVKSTYADKKPQAGPSISNMAAGKDKNVPSFWIPSKTPQAKQSVVQKPDKTIRCPMSGAPLKVKDLIPVKFTEIKDPTDKRALIVKEARYMCPVTGDTLTNSVPCAVLKSTGDVVTMDCVEKLIKKDWLHPITGEKLEDKDIIPLHRGATGFSSTNDNLAAKETKPSLQC